MRKNVKDIFTKEKKFVKIYLYSWIRPAIKIMRIRIRSSVLCLAEPNFVFVKTFAYESAEKDFDI